MTKSNIKSIVVGLLSKVRINLGGQLYGFELFSVLFFPFFSISSIYKSNPILKKITFCYAIILCSLIYSDLYNSSAFLNYVRGWSNFIFSLISIIFLTGNFGRNRNNFLFFIIAFACSNFIFGAYGEIEILNNNSNYFKVNFEPFVTPFLIVISYYLYQRVGRKIFLFFYLPDLESISELEVVEKHRSEVVRLVFIGGQANRKDLSSLISAYKIVYDSLVDKGAIDLTIISVMSDGEILIPNDLPIKHFKGLPYDETLTILRESHVYVMTSIIESFGISYIEGMASGCW
jgi:hypothetical protein